MTRLTLAALLLSSSPLWAQVPRVVADVPINHSLTALVMGDLGTPELLLDRGGDAHHAQLRPSQARAVAGADLVIWTGPALSPWMQDVIAGLSNARVLELAEVEGLIRQPFGAAREFGEHEEHDHNEHHDHEHEHGEFDPHLWMSTANAARWVEEIAETLATLDPANADTYRRNAQRSAESFAVLHSELTRSLAPAQGVGLVFHHDAFGYLARDFGLNVVGTIADGNAADPGAARIATLRADLVAAGAACIFPEVNHSDAFARIVAEGTDLRLGAPLDPEGVTGVPGPQLYAETMRALAQGIADCAQGD